MRQYVARHVYFAVQRYRGGVSPQLICNAARLLDLGKGALLSHVAARLDVQHHTGRDGLEWLARQPLVDKFALSARMQSLVSEGTRSRRELRSTSGSTGSPFRFAKDVEMTAQMDATMWAAYGWHGVSPGDRQARFWGAPITQVAGLKIRALDWLQNRRRLSAFEISRDRCLRFFHQILRFQPSYAYGYPTLLEEFVHHCASAGLDGKELKLRVVICTGEMLTHPVRESLVAFFGCRIVNEYGCTESGVLAIECEAGTMHLVPTAAYAELLNSYGTSAGPGETGEVVVTDLYGHLEPLVRYRLHDLAIPARASICVCGRDLAAIAVQQGRVDSFIETPHRGKVYDAILAYTVPSGVRKFRVQQLAVDSLHAQVVLSSGTDGSRTLAECEARWQEVLGPGVRVSVESVTDIAHSSSGKLQYFVPMRGDRGGASRCP